jgi:hypothetical protein
MNSPASPPARAAGIALALVAIALFAGIGPPTAERDGAALQTPDAGLKAPDPWTPFRFFIGRWQGRGEGNSGPFQDSADFQFVGGGRFVQVKHDLRGAPSAKNPQGDASQEFGFFSFTAARGIYELFQFRPDGSVSRYLCRKILDEGKTFIFVGVPEEGAAVGPKTKVTFKITGPQEFSLLIEVAAPDKDYEKAAAAVLKKIR